MVKEVGIVALLFTYIGYYFQTLILLWVSKKFQGKETCCSTHIQLSAMKIYVFKWSTASVIIVIDKLLGFQRAYDFNYMKSSPIHIIISLTIAMFIYIYIHFFFHIVGPIRLFSFLCDLIPFFVFNFLEKGFFLSSKNVENTNLVNYYRFLNSGPRK